jgi:signal transduction histidine kinase
MRKPLSRDIHLILWVFSLGFSTHAFSSEYLVAVDESSPPFSFEEDGALRGLVIDLVREALGSQGENVRFISLQQTENLERLNIKNIDGYVRYVPVSSGQTDQPNILYLFSSEYHRFGNRDSTNSNPSQPKKRSDIGIVENEVTEFFTSRLPESSFKYYPNSYALITDFERKKIDYFLADPHVVEYVTSGRISAKMTTDLNELGELSIIMHAASQDNHFVTNLANGLIEISRNGKRDKVFLTWLDSQVDRYQAERYKVQWLSHLSLAIVLILLAFVHFFFREKSIKRVLEGKNKQLTTLAEDLNKTNVELNKAADSKENFVSVVAHEMRTPLTTVLGLSSVALRSTTLQEANYSLEHIRRSVVGLNSLVNNVIEYSKIKHGLGQPNLEGVRVQDVIRNLEMLHRHAASEKKLNFSIDVATDVPDYIVCDRIRLAQILSNLISNSIKFTERGFVSAKFSVIGEPSDLGRRIQIVIEDSGVGMSKEHLKLIGQSYLQLDHDAHRRTKGGVGIGLSLTFEQLKLLDGKIDFFSEPGVGTKCVITLPFEATSELPDNPLSQEADDLEQRDYKKLFKNLRVLMAEDHKLNAKINKALLATVGLKVDIAFDGYEAVDRVCSAANIGSPYHLVLMDVQMPGMSGIEATVEIQKSLAKDAPIIIALTAGVTDEQHHAVFTCGMKDLIQKPFEPNAAARVIMRNLLVEGYGYDGVENFEN